MDLMLTSFGVNEDDTDDSHSKRSVFYRMPPTTLALRGAYLAPDYLALLLFDRVILDEDSYDRLSTHRHWSYNRFAELARALDSEGFLRIESYSVQLEDHRRSIAVAVERDLESFEEWQPLLKIAIERWSNFIRLLRDDYRAFYERLLADRNETAHAPAADTVRSHQHSLHSYGHVAGADITHLQYALHHRDLAREILRWYLTYVNTNVVLAQELGVPLYDWFDYQPFYERKLATIAEAQASQTRQVRQLFEVAFPEFAIDTPQQLLKLLSDKRIKELRSLVNAAVAGEVVFDREFAVRTLFEVLSGELAIGRYRSITSYALMPVGFVPGVGTPLQKAAEELAAIPYERTRRAKYGWFYLLSEAKAGVDSHSENGAV